MCIGLIGYSIADLIIITQFVKRLLPKVTFGSIARQLMPSFLLAVIMGICTYLYIIFIPYTWLQLVGGICLGGILYLMGAHFINLKELTLILQKIKK